MTSLAETGSAAAGGAGDLASKKWKRTNRTRIEIARRIIITRKHLQYQLGARLRRLTAASVASSFRALFQPLMKTFSAKANEVDRKWWLIDAKDQVLGHIAVKAATLLRGKEK